VQSTEEEEEEEKEETPFLGIGQQVVLLETIVYPIPSTAQRNHGV
jgi:hypothetical protein